MLAAWTPIARAVFTRRAALRERVGALLVLRFPEASARKPFHHRVGVARLQLAQRGQQFFFGVGAEGGGFAFQNDRPVMVPGRHDASDYGSFADPPFGSRRLSFSMSVVRFRLSSFAACRLLPCVRSSERRMSDSSTASM